MLLFVNINVIKFVAQIKFLSTFRGLAFGITPNSLFNTIWLNITHSKKNQPSDWKK